MSAMVTVCQRLASAWVVIFGKYGDVTRQAAVRGQSRQALYREAEQVLEAVAGEKSQARIVELEQRVTELTAQVQELHERLRGAVEITPDLQSQYASTAQAVGVSLAVARELLAVFLQERTPSVATLGRQTQQVAKRAGEVLQVLDALVRPQVQQVAADEIFLASVPR
jgi:hypothetical protein